MEDLAISNSEYRFPAASGACGARGVGKGECVRVMLEDGEVRAGSGCEGADFVGEAQDGCRAMGSAPECFGDWKANSDEFGEGAGQVVRWVDTHVADVLVAGDGVRVKSLCDRFFGYVEVERGIAVAEVEKDATFPGFPDAVVFEKIFWHGVKAVGDDVARTEAFELVCQGTVRVTAGAYEQGQVGALSGFDGSGEDFVWIGWAAADGGGVDGDGWNGFWVRFHCADTGVHVCIVQIFEAAAGHGFAACGEVDGQEDSGAGGQDSLFEIGIQVGSAGIALGHGGGDAPGQDVLVRRDSVFGISVCGMGMQVHEAGKEKPVGRRR